MTDPAVLGESLSEGVEGLVERLTYAFRADDLWRGRDEVDLDAIGELFGLAASALTALQAELQSAKASRAREDEAWASEMLTALRAAEEEAAAWKAEAAGEFIKRQAAEAAKDEAFIGRQALRSLEGDLEAAEAERDAQKADAQKWFGEALDQKARALLAEQGVERAREALEEIEDLAPATQEVSPASMMANIAHAALSAHQGEVGNG